MAYWQYLLSTIIACAGFPIGQLILRSVPEEQAGKKYFETSALLLIIGFATYALATRFSILLLIGCAWFLFSYFNRRSALQGLLFAGLVFPITYDLAALILIVAFGLCHGALAFSPRKRLTLAPCAIFLGVSNLLVLLF